MPIWSISISFYVYLYLHLSLHLSLYLVSTVSIKKVRIIIGMVFRLQATPELSQNIQYTNLI